jgi:hypothetical protein
LIAAAGNYGQEVLQQARQLAVQLLGRPDVLEHGGAILAILDHILPEQLDEVQVPSFALAAGAMTWPDIQAMLSFASGQMDNPQAAWRIMTCWIVLLVGYRELIERHEVERYGCHAVPELNDPRSAARFQILQKLLAQVLLRSEPLAAALLRLQPSSAAGGSSEVRTYVRGLQLVQQVTAVHRGDAEEAQPACLQAPLLQHWLGHCTVLAQAAEVSSRVDWHTT